jgi:hypothetical protein
VIHLPIEVAPARGEAAQHPLSGRDRVDRRDVAQLPRMVQEGDKREVPQMGSQRFGRPLSANEGETVGG